MKTPVQRSAFAAVALALFTSAASGQTIFRCGASYSQSPCANATVLEGVAPPTDAQRAEARSVAARERLLALEIVQDRRERDSAMPPANAGSLGPLAAARPASAPAAPKKHTGKKKRAVPEDGRDFIAAVPRTTK